MIVHNNSKSVKVLKAAGKVPLRLLPGYNDIGNKKLDDYTAGNKAAKAISKEFLKTVESDVLSGNDLAEAAASKEKNDKLNTAYKVVMPAKDGKQEKTK